MNNHFWLFIVSSLSKLWHIVYPKIAVRHCITELFKIYLKFFFQETLPSSGILRGTYECTLRMGKDWRGGKFPKCIGKDHFLVSSFLGPQNGPSKGIFNVWRMESAVLRCFLASKLHKRQISMQVLATSVKK